LDKGDVVGVLVVAGIGAAGIGALLGIVFGIVTIAKWAWGS